MPEPRERDWSHGGGIAAQNTGDQKFGFLRGFVGVIASKEPREGGEDVSATLEEKNWPVLKTPQVEPDYSRQVTPRR